MNAIQPDFSHFAKPMIHYSRNYAEKIKSCSLTIEDLRNIYNILVQKADEAADHELKLSVDLPDQVKEIFKNLKGKLWVQIWGENNEYINGDHESIFDDKRLPEKILQIRFNGYTGYQFVKQSQMQNWFELQFDFRKIPVFNFLKISDTINQNNSYLTIQGNNETWVDGVYQAINNFLKNKFSKRNWLHSSFTYDVLLYFIFFPLTLRVAYRLGTVLNIQHLTTPLTVAIYLYIFIVSLYGFRILYNYARWIFPAVEMKNKDVSASHRFVLVTLVLSVIGTTIYDLIKAIPSFW